MDQDAKEILAQLGLSNLEEGLLGGEPPVPVNKGQLRAYWEKTLSPREEAVVAHLVSNYQAWDDALDEIVLENAGKPSDRERLAVAMWMHWLMRKRMLIAVSMATLMLVIGLFLFRGHPGEMRDGSQRVAYRNGTVTGFEEYGGEWSSKAATAFSTGLELPTGLQEIDASLPAVRAGLPKSPVLVSPYGAAVRGTHPVFEWKPFANIHEYTIELRKVQSEGLAGEFAVAAKVEQQQSVRLDRDLAAGQVYQWKLKYDHNGVTKEVPRSDQQPALFRVLTAEELDTLQDAEKQVRESHLLRFLLYIEFGLLHEAKTQLDRLRQQNPSSELMQTLNQHWEEFQLR